jgi:PAS domain S-box-containing protein
MWLRIVRYLVGVTALGMLYIVTGRLGLALEPESGFATLVWPPTGIALAAILLFGYRYWPGIAAGAFLLNLYVAMNRPQPLGSPWLTAGGMGIGNTLEALLGAYLLRRGTGFQPELGRIRDVLALIFRGAALSTPVSASIGVFSLWLGGGVSRSDLGVTWLTWFVGDVLGAVVFAPLVLTWVARPLPRLSARRVVEAALIVVSLLVVGTSVFATTLQDTRLEYLIFPVLIWAALRFGPRGAASVTFATLLLAVWGVTHQAGPFARETLSGSLALLQLFVGAAAVTGLILAAVVAERSRAEQSARESETRANTLAQAVPGILFTCRPDGWTDYTNQQFYDYTGMSPESANGFGWTAALHPDDRERTRAQWLACVLAGRPFETEYRFRAKSGAYRWFLARGVPLCDDHGRIAKWFGTCIDIDGQKRAEGALREADYRKDEFLAMLAHELRNPLTPIVNALRVTELGGNMPEDVQWANGLIERQVGHLVRLVDDLLDVSRITRGMITLRKERVGLSAIVEQAVESVRPLIMARRHELTVVLPPEPLWVEADPTRLVQIVANLLNNAAKYTESGGRIGISVERKDGAIVLRVTDSGSGIDPDLLPRVFDLFVQADPTLARTHGGLGIGLTLVRRLVELHGGQVAAQSDGRQKGSEFVVRLPAIPAANAEAPPAASGEKLATERPLQLLVVDDNVDAAESLAMFLRMQGHEVYVAYDGGAAFEAAQLQAPDVVLLDIGLPVLTGYEVAEQLKQREGTPKSIVVALTGYGREVDRERARVAGFDYYLVKPVDPAKLLRLLAKIAAGPKNLPSGRLTPARATEN